MYIKTKVDAFVVLSQDGTGCHLAVQERGVLCYRAV